MHQNVYIPDEFIQLISQQMPSHLQLDELLEACKRPLKRSIRVNTLKISVDEFKSQAKDMGWQLTPVPWCSEGFWLDNVDDSQTALGNTSQHLAGLFYIQEASSMMPVTALFDQFIADSDSRVLDMAAAPGSKTTQIAAKLNNNGLVIANEFSASRVKILFGNLMRCGVGNMAMTNFDARVFGPWLPETFDAILLDAPCSGEGSLRKDADAMKNWSLASVEEIAQTQKDLIESAFHALKPGGTLVYSTCTLNQQENQQVAQHLMDTFADSVEIEPLNDLFEDAAQSLTEEGYIHVYPQIYDCEGFFIARFKKIGSVEAPQVKKRLGKFPFTRMTDKESHTVTNALHDTLGIKLSAQYCLWQRDNEVWLFPTLIEPLLTKMRFQRIGIKLAEAHKKGYRWYHQGIVAMSQHNEQNAVELTLEEAREWYMGRDIRPQTVSGKGEVLIRYDNVTIGIGKWVGNRIKNGLPREMVRDNNLF
ncbi:16S rRNA (cytosine(1407)-C(5))-methyltransferase RsmF [Vibrio sp. UCD-FRSSP16_10]|uniref:16S rRNA (cytosine(1407)-C(5))-methyltransferase RsmF n=1 Tax=unclassified Vibrio TaxID=2614977 RepID=UPI00080096D9|nr:MULTISPECIES: 16S rRNA (cytosine(1407)-C(5))-methyltransferase RsmF [unclassified Vibrio]OBT12210.1 16S rRNA (cytosine(1407)-C(5))-methyltransferase RsmF [Vibrio sp. UCD-FRSSP16_30]OBT20541.1 16S rRNA (cytosine(1407)-C(5))-methyltransferase RsmF [Vibrio sp. UCD-FRSSP16_10]